MSNLFLFRPGVEPGGWGGVFRGELFCSWRDRNEIRRVEVQEQWGEERRTYVCGQIRSMVCDEGSGWR